MAHFAKIENGRVTNCIVIENSDCGDLDFPASEPIGQAFIASLGFSGDWKQTSYNRNFSGNYAGVGMFWNGSVFHGPPPYSSWVLNSYGSWDPPVPKPTGSHVWDEATISWIPFSTLE